MFGETTPGAATPKLPGDDATEGFSKFLRGITRLSGAASRTDGGANGVMFDVSNEKNPGCLGCIGGYTTLCYRVYYIPLWESLSNDQYPILFTFI